ncbi:MAG: response regulator [Chitinophagaceae bacterium]|nr:MAG: response regulator [Chitinophagaceae bacterium]
MPRSGTRANPETAPFSIYHFKEIKMQVPADILYIEDNEDYIEFMKRAMSKINSSLRVNVVTDGKGTLQYIDDVTGIEGLPKLILLDINLPDYNGLDLLAKIRSHKSLRYIPVVMLSSSENPVDIRKALDGGANAYLVKPMGLAPLMETLRSICNFWLNHHQTVESFAA